MLVTQLAYCSHRPNISMYVPFEFVYNSRGAQDWMINNPATRMTIYHVGGLINKAFPKSLT